MKCERLLLVCVAALSLCCIAMGVVACTTSTPPAASSTPASADGCAGDACGATEDQPATTRPSGVPAVNHPQSTPPAPRRVATLPTPEPAPVPAQAPVHQTSSTGTREHVVVPAGTTVEIELLRALASDETTTGSPVHARVATDVLANGYIAIPAGSTIAGRVSEVQSPKAIGGRAKLGFTLDSVALPWGDEVAIHAQHLELGKSETKKDAATIGGAAAGGALLGRMIEKDDKTKGTLIGAAVGAAVGTAVAHQTKGEELHLAPGTMFQVSLDEPVEVELRR